MIHHIKKLELLATQVSEYVIHSSEEILSEKRSQERWSKKEILGHLIDSAINNLQRFTEVHFKEKPFRLESYDQDELVKANRYQEAESDEILKLLKAINRRIIDIIKVETEETLEYKFVTDNGTFFNLKYLIEDYVNHFEHHAKQIIE